MRILIDTNVILDVILQREPFYDDSKQILIACQQELLQGTITTQSIADIYYILRKDFSSTERRRILLGLCEIFHVSTIDREMLVAALKNESFDDLEDCLQAESAALFGAEYVLTRNVKHFTTSPVPAITPKAFCEHMKSLKP
jgi:predicted nucleic acid-binding protein